jgi:hypothetical protein
MPKLPKLTDKHRFLLAIQKAVTDYDRSRGGANWTPAQLDEVAKSAAIQYGLSYDGDEVDPLIVMAIRTTANPKNSEVEQKRARDDAWTKYSAHK